MLFQFNKIGNMSVLRICRLLVLGFILVYPSSLLWSIPSQRMCANDPSYPGCWGSQNCTDNHRSQACHRDRCHANADFPECQCILNPNSKECELETCVKTKTNLRADTEVCFCQVYPNDPDCEPSAPADPNTNTSGQNITSSKDSTIDQLKRQKKELNWKYIVGGGAATAWLTKKCAACTGWCWYCPLAIGAGVQTFTNMTKSKEEISHRIRDLEGLPSGCAGSPDPTLHLCGSS